MDSFVDQFSRAYTGYIDFDAKHLFFYFFESRNDPDKDDVIFWTNGGEAPSLINIFFQLTLRAQCQVLVAPRLLDFSWNWVRSSETSHNNNYTTLEFRAMSSYQCSR